MGLRKGGKFPVVKAETEIKTCIQGKKIEHQNMEYERCIQTIEILHDFIINDLQKRFSLMNAINTTPQIL